MKETQLTNKQNNIEEQDSKSKNIFDFNIVKQRYGIIKNWEEFKKLFNEDMQEFIKKYPPVQYANEINRYELHSKFIDWCEAIKFGVCESSWAKERKKHDGIGSVAHTLELFFKSYWQSYLIYCQLR